MSWKILSRAQLGPDFFEWEVAARDVARAARPGQFVMVRLHDGSERIPLTLADWDPGRGTVVLVIQAVGKSTREMMFQPAGTELASLAGPLGRPSVIEPGGHVVLLGGGLGVAPLHPQAKAFRAAGARVTCAVGFRSRDRVFWEDRLRATSDELLIATEDGSAGRKGRVTDLLDRLLASGEPIERVVAIGPLAMMRACAERTRAQRLPTTVSLNPIMVDGTGMCGSCRVWVAGELKLACTDGPEFDGHAVDFEDLELRQRRFTGEERDRLEHFGGSCGLALQDETGAR